MRSIAWIASAVCIFAILNSTYAEDPAMVIEVFRHGARGGKYYPNFQISFGLLIGELTPVGMHQHYILGQMLKKAYPTLLQKYDANKIYVKASNYNRTLMSAYSQLYGVFEGTGNNFSSDFPLDLTLPPVNTEGVKNSFLEVIPNNFQPVPIDSVELINDVLLQPGGPACPYADELLNKQINGELPKEMAHTFSSTLEQLGKMFNMPSFSVTDAVHLFDDVISAEYNNMTLPVNLTLDSPLGKNLTFLYNYLATNAGFGTAEQNQLQSVNLLTEIVGLLESKANGSSSLEFVFFSGHDTTMMPILGLFNIVTLDCIYKNFFNKADYPECMHPRFASHMQFELYIGKNNQTNIKFKYNGVIFNICGTTDGSCTLENFRDMISNKLGDYTVALYDEKCGRTQSPNVVYVNQPVSIGLKIGVFVLGLIAIILFVMIILTLFRKMPKSSQSRTESLIPA